MNIKLKNNPNFILKIRTNVNYILLALVFTFQIAASQNSTQISNENRKFAEYQLEFALSKKSGHNVIDQKNSIIKDTLTAIHIAENILFSYYDKTSIINQQPYEIHHINNYWVIFGTLPKSYKGGVFLIILDDRNSEIIKLTHGK
jgi:hypothetical protein